MPRSRPALLTALDRLELRYPASFLTLLLIAFTIVTLPLVLGIAANAVAIERLSQHSQEAIARAIGPGTAPGGAALAGVETANVRAAAAKARNQVLWQLLAMVPAALLMVGLFSYLLTRPIRDLDGAIRRLGRGKVAKRIRVAGPRDIVRLGQQLDWLRQRFIALEDQKTRFFQHVSHELKTPLTAVREGSALLSDEVLGQLNDDQREVARILRQNAQSLEQLIQDLLTYSQSQSATRFERAHALTVAPVELRQLIGDVLDGHSLTLAARGLSMRRECEKANIAGDAAKLRIAFDNLVSNAIKYSHAGGTITVRLIQSPDGAVVEVLDTGPGIAEEDRERIFDPFYRATAAVQAGTKGSGLGLAIVRDYIELHGGSIAVIAHEGGARFRVILPAAPPQDD